MFTATPSQPHPPARMVEGMNEMEEEYHEDTVSIEISFPVPVNLSGDHQRQIVEVVDRICREYKAHHPDRAMWAGGIGGAIVSMPLTREDEENGVPLEFDMSVFSVEVCERENYDFVAPRTVP